MFLDCKTRKEYDTLWNVSLEDDSVDMGNMDWEDEERTDPIDISAVLDGEIPIMLVGSSMRW